MTHSRSPRANCPLPPTCSWCVSRRETLPEGYECARETSARRTCSCSRSLTCRDRDVSGTHLGRIRDTRPARGRRGFTRNDDTPRRRRTLRARFLSLLRTILPAAAATNVECPKNRGHLRDAAAHRNTIISREYP